MVGTTWRFCWISDLSFFKMLFIFRRNDIRRTLLLPSGVVVTQQLPGIQVKWPRVIGAGSPRYRDQERLCGLEKDICSLLNSYLESSGHLCLYICKQSGGRISPADLFWQHQTRGEMWFVFFAFEILLQKGSRTRGQSLQKKNPLGEFSLWPLPSQVGVILLGDCLHWLEIKQYFKCKVFHRQLSN